MWSWLPLVFAIPVVLSAWLIYRVARGWLRLNLAAGWNDFVEAMRLIEAPQLNVAYADTAGNIGYWCTGRVPIRAQGKGDVPVPGWTGEYAWIGEVPFEEMPHALNPQQGYLVTCNHRLVPDDYPHFLGDVWMNGYRARRITEVLASKPKLSPEDFAALHVDTTRSPRLSVPDAVAVVSLGPSRISCSVTVYAFVPQAV